MSITNKNFRDKNKSIFGLIDDFDDIDAPRLKQFRISDKSMEPPKGICLL